MTVLISQPLAEIHCLNCSRKIRRFLAIEKGKCGYYRVVYHLTLDRVLLNALNFYHTVEDLSYERLDLALAVVPKTCTSMTGPYKLGFSKWEGGECSVNGLPNT